MKASLVTHVTHSLRAGQRVYVYENGRRSFGLVTDIGQTFVRVQLDLGVTLYAAPNQVFPTFSLEDYR